MKRDKKINVIYKEAVYLLFNTNQKLLSVNTIFIPPLPIKVIIIITGARDFYIPNVSVD